MKQRGRRSSLAHAVVIEGVFSSRPEPPQELTARQVEIWRLVTASEDPNFFVTGTTRGLLADYCRRREAAETLSFLIDEFKIDWIKTADGALRYKQLLQMRDMEVRGTASLATKLRLTNQSRYHHERATTAGRNAVAKVAKPWEL
jgi:hypothetical protein